MHTEHSHGLPRTMDRSRSGLALLLTLALVAGGDSLAAQSTTAEGYGEFRYSFNFADDAASDRFAAANNASRFGARGSIEERGLTALLDLQTGVGVDREAGVVFTPRYHFVGLRGSFGALTVGRQTTSYKAVGVRLDPFYDSSTLDVAGRTPGAGLFAGASYGLSILNNGFSDATLSYLSPALRGVTVNGSVSVVADSSADYGLGVAVRRSGLEGGLQRYVARSTGAWVQAGGVRHADRVHVGYAWAASSMAGVSYERVARPSHG